MINGVQLYTSFTAETRVTAHHTQAQTHTHTHSRTQHAFADKRRQMGHREKLWLWLSLLWIWIMFWQTHQFQLLHFRMWTMNESCVHVSFASTSARFALNRLLAAACPLACCLYSHACTRIAFYLQMSFIILCNCGIRWCCARAKWICVSVALCILTTHNVSEEKWKFK